jgi:hypothetical protein
LMQKKSKFAKEFAEIVVSFIWSLKSFFLSPNSFSTAWLKCWDCVKEKEKVG